MASPRRSWVGVPPGWLTILFFCSGWSHSQPTCFCMCSSVKRKAHSLNKSILTFACSWLGCRCEWVAGPFLWRDSIGVGSSSGLKSDTCLQPPEIRSCRAQREENQLLSNWHLEVSSEALGCKFGLCGVFFFCSVLSVLLWFTSTVRLVFFGSLRS